MAVLVGFATRRGASRGVAERIAETLREADLDVHLRALTGAEDAADYEAVVFGSSVYSAEWLPEAQFFARHSAEALRDRPTWAFTVGRTCDGDGIPQWLRGSGGGAAAPGRSGVLDHRFFVLSAFEREVFASAGGRCGGLRDWPEIDTWAYRIGEAVAPALLMSIGAAG